MRGLGGKGLRWMLLVLLTEVACDAGYAGIQAALSLQHYGITDYVVLEQHSEVGSFWKSFPLFRELISVNRKVPNEEHALRYDWHTLLHAPLSLQNVTESFFPQRAHIVEYLTRISKGLNIVFNKTVTSIEAGPCVQLASGEQICARKRLLIGTGLRFKQQDWYEAIGAVPYSRVVREMARGQSVCILGNGNSAFEVAQNVYDIAERLVIVGKHPARINTITHYTGDVRIKYLQVLENFHNKVLDTMFHCNKAYPDLGQELSENELMQCVVSLINAENCSLLVYATGFESVVPGGQLKGRYPETRAWWEDAQIDNVHYIGWLMHEDDFRQGAGGFVSGFRYLIEQLIHHLREVDWDTPFPVTRLASIEDAAQLAISRLRTNSDLIVMQGGKIIRDVVLPEPDGKGYMYYEGVPHKIFDPQGKGLHFYFEWGNVRSCDAVFHEKYYDENLNLRNVMLHPTFRAPGGKVFSLQEQIDMQWARDVDTEPGERHIVKQAFAEAFQKANRRKLPWVDDPSPQYQYEVPAHPPPDARHHLGTRRRTEVVPDWMELAKWMLRLHSQFGGNASSSAEWLPHVWRRCTLVHPVLCNTSRYEPPFAAKSDLLTAAPGLTTQPPPPPSMPPSPSTQLSDLAALLVSIQSFSPELRVRVCRHASCSATCL